MQDGGYSTTPVQLKDMRVWTDTPPGYNAKRAPSPAPSKSDDDDDDDDEDDN